MLVDTAPVPLPQDTATAGGSDRRAPSGHAEGTVSATPVPGGVEVGPEAAPAVVADVDTLDSGVAWRASPQHSIRIGYHYHHLHPATPAEPVSDTAPPALAVSQLAFDLAGAPLPRARRVRTVPLPAPVPPPPPVEGLYAPYITHAENGPVMNMREVLPRRAKGKGKGKGKAEAVETRHNYQRLGH